MRYQDRFKNRPEKKRHFTFGDERLDTTCQMRWWMNTREFRVQHNSNTPLKQLAKECRLFCGGFKHDSGGRKLKEFDPDLPDLHHGETYHYRLLRFVRDKDKSLSTSWRFISAFFAEHPEYIPATLREGCNWLLSFQKRAAILHGITFAGSCLAISKKKTYIPHITFGTGYGTLLCTDKTGGHFDPSDMFLVRVPPNPE